MRESDLENSRNSPLLGLARVWVYRRKGFGKGVFSLKPSPFLGALLPHLFTLTLCVNTHKAVCFLWHFPALSRPRSGSISLNGIRAPSETVFCGTFRRSHAPAPAPSALTGYAHPLRPNFPPRHIFSAPERPLPALLTHLKYRI